MFAKTKILKKNPLTKAQKKLLSESLKKLLGYGLIEEHDKRNEENKKEMVIKNALNAIVLNN